MTASNQTVAIEKEDDTRNNKYLIDFYHVILLFCMKFVNIINKALTFLMLNMKMKENWRNFTC